MRKIYLLLIIMCLFISAFSFAAVQKGSLQVTSDPSGADVYVNGILKGKTPVKVEDVPLGNVGIKLSKSGYRDDIKLIGLKGMDNSYNRKLTPLQETNELVQLNIDSTQRDADVFINDKLMGKIPFSKKFPTGNYRIKISKAGYEDYIINLMLYKEKAYYINLKKLIGVPVVVEKIKASEIKPVKKVTDAVVLPVQPEKVIGKVVKRGYAKSAYTGIFKVSSNVPNAKVYVDGTYAGFAPISVTVPSIDMHDIVVMKSGYHNYEVKKSVDLEDVEEVNAVLVEDVNQIGKVGSFYVTSMPAGASVYIDNEYKGVTPLLAKKIIEGKHNIRITKSGYNEENVQKYLAQRMTVNIMSNLVADMKSSNPRYGEFSIKSNPSDAAVYVDGQLKGNTPLNVKDVYTGRHDIVLKANGYKDFETTKYIYSEELVNVNANLVPLQKEEAKLGSLYVRSIPSGADVYVNNVLKGKTPYSQTNVVPGTYNVQMVKQGYTEYVKEVKVESGKTENVWAEIKKVK